MLDQWDIGYGDDLAAYMSRCVRSADRVLMIYTESYVNKANDDRGGVGYEHMIVTGELMQDIGTSKFVPIIRQTSSLILLPAALRSRFYVNMNDGPHLEEEWEKLLRELNNVPMVSKPPLGANPYAFPRWGGMCMRMLRSRLRHPHCPLIPARSVALLAL